MSEKHQFSNNDLLRQETYLMNGELIKWKGEMKEVYSTISTTNEYKPTLLGTVPNMDKETALDVLNSAVTAYDKGKGEWPTMTVEDRISCMKRFVSQMRNHREKVVKFLMW